MNPLNPSLLYELGKPRFPFETIWNTENSVGSAGHSLTKQIKLPLVSTGTYNFTVDWGDGTTNQITVWNAATTTHTYSVAGVKTIKIKGIIIGWSFNETGDRNKITSVVSWGPFRLGTSSSSFKGCQNLNLSTVKDVLNFDTTTNLLYLFGNLNSPTTSLTSINNLTKWRFNPNTDLTTVFRNLDGFNQDVNDLDVTNVKIFDQTFGNNAVFNSPLDKWTPINATDMHGMFLDCPIFNQPLVKNGNKWNTSNVVDMSSLFNNADAFNQNINSWNTTSCTDMSFMFQSAAVYNQQMNPYTDGDGEHWNTSNVTTMASMFGSAINFNNGLATGVSGIMQWNTGNVTNMGSVFQDATSFNQDVSGWDVSKATNFLNIFEGANKFNQNLSSWNTGAATSVQNMFLNATIFNNGQLSGIGGSLDFETVNVTNMAGMFNTCPAFNQSLNPSGNIWNTGSVTSMTSMFASAAKFNNGLASGAEGTLSWNTSNVTTMVNIFQSATAFNQNVNSWDVRKVTSLSGAFQNLPNYNQPLQNWQTLALTNMTNTFSGGTIFNQSLNSTPGSFWDASKITTMSNTFANCIAFNNGITPAGDPGTWTFNTSTSLLDLSTTFNGCTSFNQNINSWIVTNVTLFSSTFQNCSKFNQPLNLWDTRSATLFNSTFSGCTIFNQDISMWDTRALTNMFTTFGGCTAFNSALNPSGFIWNTSLVTTFASLFNGCTNFNNGQLPGVGGTLSWNTGNVNTMFQTFLNASSFNQDISSWTFPKVTTFASMFSNATNFNNGLPPGVSGVWNIGTLLPAGNISMASMFSGASSFNQDISSWDMTKVTNVSSMFTNATAFDQNLGAWNMSTVTTFTNFMSGKTAATFSAANLDAIYNGWIANELGTAKSISFGTAKYTVAGVEGRGLLARTNTTKTVTGSSNNGGLIRLTVTAHGLTTNNKVFNKGILGTTNANGLWIVTVVDVNTIELQGSVFNSAWVAGGTQTCRTGYGWTITDGGNDILTGIVASYTLNNVTTDATGLSPTGTAAGITYVAGKTGNCAVFDNLNDKIDIADTTNLSFTDGVDDIPFSINMWVYFTGFSITGNFLFNKRANTLGNNEYQFTYSTSLSAIRFVKIDKLDSGATIYQGMRSPTSIISLNTWYNITWTDDGSKTFAGMKMYINGVEQTVTELSAGSYTGMPNGTSITRMGQAAFGVLDDNSRHQGRLEDVSVWKGKVLSQAEVTYLYNGGAGRTYPF